MLVSVSPPACPKSPAIWSKIAEKRARTGQITPFHVRKIIVESVAEQVVTGGTGERVEFPVIVNPTTEVQQTKQPAAV